MSEQTYNQKLIKQVKDLKGMSDDYTELLDNVISQLRALNRMEQDIGEMAGILKDLETPFECTVSGEHRFETSDELIPLAKDYKKMKSIKVFRPRWDVDFDQDAMNDNLDHEGLDFEFIPPKDNKPYTKIYIFEKDDV
jgi:hypothetical protein